jgi:hypothetical protein
MKHVLNLKLNQQHLNKVGLTISILNNHTKII